VAVTFDAAAPSSAVAGTSATSWSHTNSGNAIVVGVIWDSGGTDVTTAISYGGVALSKLGSIPGDNGTAGGISLWGRIGGLPSGSNTVSVTTGSTSCFGGSMSFFGAAAFGSAQTFFGNGNPISVGATGTDPNGMIAAASSYGGGAGGGTFSATGAATQRFGVIGNNGGGSSNSEGETAPSAAGTVTFGWSQSNGNADFWGMVAVEVLSGTINPDNAGSTAVITGVTSATLDITAAAVGAACYALVSVGSSNAGATSIAATGWTVVQAAADSTTAEYAVLRRIKQSGDTTFTVTWSTSAHAELTWASWTGVDPVTPDEQSAIATNGATSRTAVPTPTATPTAANRWAVGFFAARTSTSANKAITWTPDAAQTERVDANNSAGTSSVWFGNEIADTAGAVSQTSHSYTATHAPAAESHDASAILFLIPVAAAPVAPPPPPPPIPPGRLSPATLRLSPPPPAPAPTSTTWNLVANLSGSGSLSGTGVFAGSAALSGSGTLSGTGAFAGSATLTGSGSLTATGAFAGSAGLTGSGTLNVPGVTLGYSATLTGSGSLQATGAFAGSSTLSGTGSLTGNVTLGYSTTLTGSGTLSGSGAFAGSATLTGSGTLSVSGEVLGYSSTLTGSGTLQAAGAFGGFATLSGSGTLNIPGVTLGYSTTLSGSGTLSATGAVHGLVPGSATLTGSGTLSGTGVFAGSAALSGSGTLLSAGAFTNSPVLSGLGTLLGSGVLAASTVLSGSGTLLGAGAFAGRATLTGSGTITGVGVFGGSALLTGSGALSAHGGRITFGQASLTGSGTLFAQATHTGSVPPTGVFYAWLGQPRWTADLQPLPWSVSLTQGWVATLTQRWVVTLITLSIYSTSLEDVPILVEAPPGVDPTLDQVQFAFTATAVSPTSGFVSGGGWAAGKSPFLALCPVGPGGATQLAAATYYVWWKKLAGFSPESPVKLAGQLTVLP